MRFSSMTITASFILAALFLGVAATHPPNKDPERTNIKVLPKKISDIEMEALMERYSKQLGVGCEYCHVETKPGIFPKRVDFASDERPEKNIARKMIKMLLYINRKYYKTDNDREAIIHGKVSCGMCHQGHPRPD
jgi:hypothetical protein